MSECEAVTRNGRVCGAHAMRGSQYCYMHAPEKEGERAAARRLGGHRRGAHAGDASSLPASIKTIEDVLTLLDYTREELSALDNGIPRARALIALAGEYIHALDIGSIEARILALEEAARNEKA